MNTPDEILNKLFRYCAYQERCKQELRKKMQELGAFPEEVEEIIDFLEEEGFVNEVRFARVFAGGKFRVKRWGKQKIKNELRKRKIPDTYIEQALHHEIPHQDYESSITYLISKKIHSPISKASLAEKQKIFRFLQQKGYEWAAIQQVWEDLVAEDKT